MRSRYQTTSHDKTMHFEKLEEDILLSFIAGKPLIGDPAQLRMVFQFKTEKQEQKGYVGASP